MRRKGNGSPIASEIVNDYRRENEFKRKMQRQKCKEQNCDKCRWSPICEDREIVDESEVQ